MQDPCAVFLRTVKLRYIFAALLPFADAKTSQTQDGTGVRGPDRVAARRPQPGTGIWPMQSNGDRLRQCLADAGQLFAYEHVHDAQGTKPGTN